MLIFRHPCNSTRALLYYMDKRQLGKTCCLFHTLPSLLHQRNPGPCALEGSHESETDLSPRAPGVVVSRVRRQTICQPSQSLHLSVGLGGADTDRTVYPRPPELLCLQNHMRASVSVGYLLSLGYSARDLVIPGWDRNYQCQPQIASSQVTFTVPYSGCGSTQQVSLELLPLPPAEPAFLQRPAPCFVNSGDPGNMSMV